MQLLVPLGEVGARATIGRRASVYWPDEGEWYNGVVSAAQASPAALKIAYDDGDSRWEHVRNTSSYTYLRRDSHFHFCKQEHALKWILLLQAANEAPVSLRTLTGNSEVIVTSAPPSPPGQVLYARPYKQVVSDHFEPVRIARPYRCAVEKHSESVIFPRRPYRERRYLHVVHESLECFRYSQHATAPSSLQLDKVDCTAQASLPSFLPELSS
ncbi:unnamed protein product [Phytophthora lilii]|uniref:Unnamed protein product n=1 Tax=Phytophthora lilii TaxID=2077276 RepID=A0A9W6TEP2_9STRA|nr:unnamed protein product [Phytophthora lilii]